MELIFLDCNTFLTIGKKIFQVFYDNCIMYKCCYF